VLDGAHRLGRAQGVLALGEDGAQIGAPDSGPQALPETAQVLHEPPVPLLRSQALDHQGETVKLIRRLTAAVLPAKGRHRR
jgi:hypothetical protein